MVRVLRANVEEVTVNTVDAVKAGRVAELTSVSHPPTLTTRQSLSFSPSICLPRSFSLTVSVSSSDCGGGGTGQQPSYSASA